LTASAAHVSPEPMRTLAVTVPPLTTLTADKVVPNTIWPRPSPHALATSAIHHSLHFILADPILNQMVNLPGDLDSTFAALSDPTRRAILAKLSEGEQNVSTLAAPLPMSLVAVGKHLAVLEKAGLVRSRKAGRTRICALTPAPLGRAADWIDGYRNFWSTRLDALASYLVNKEEEA
jgi:DNA-binding transcriptional ArsR family regulator